MMISRSVYNLLLFIVMMCLSVGFVYGQTTQTIYYVGSDEIFPNPERGFSAYKSNAITPSYVASLRSQNVTVIQRIYTVPAYNDEPFPQDFLDLVTSDLAAARAGGAKCVLRFSYTNNQNGADAPLDIILAQIEQLGPILQFSPM